VVAAARGHLRESRATLQGMERLTVQLAPERTLERGFSLTRDAAGAILRHPDQAAAGDLITTRVSGGTLESRVEKS
jgi:exodeoxyribonuclease VII large subunit